MSGPRPAHAEYTQRRADFDKLAGVAAQRFIQLGNLRLLVAVSAAAMAYLSFSSRAFSPVWLAAPAALFVLLIILHELTLRRQRRAERGRRIYERGLDRLDDKWMGRGDSGERFRDPSHPYSDDLDVFGYGSLFELLCTVRTPVGEQTLAAWLRSAATPDEARSRQAAVEELRSRLDLREQIALLGEDVRAGLHPEALISWAAAPPIPFPGWTRAVAVALVAVTLSVAALATYQDWPLSVVLLPLMLQIGFALWLRPLVLNVIAGMDVAGRDLSLLAEVLGRLEAEPFQCEYLRALQERLKTAGQPPSRELDRLRRLRELMDSRRHAFFAPLAGLLLWGTQFALSLEQWRRTHGASVAAWLQALGEMEAICALSAYAYEHPNDPFPAFAENGPACLVAEALGHPLLPDARCVRNDLSLGREARLLIVSGSNMSGKSTLLRAVGLNAVLAWAGAPVRAKSLLVSPLLIGTSLRPQDSLQTGTSRFYAEITRLRDLVNLSRGPVPLLFLLDELLSGTNSYDRQRGSAGVLTGLMATPAIGLLTTHDLALAALADTLPETVNVHFEDRLIEGELQFDYRLREGIVQRSNAIELMRSIGLSV